MSHHLELTRRLSSIRAILHNMGDLIAYVGLESQIILIEQDDEEIRSQWNSLSLEFSDLSDSLNLTLKKVSMAAKNNKAKMPLAIQSKPREALYCAKV